MQTVSIFYASEKLSYVEYLYSTHFIVEKIIIALDLLHIHHFFKYIYIFLNIKIFM